MIFLVNLKSNFSGRMPYGRRNILYGGFCVKRLIILSIRKVLFFPFH